MPKQSSPRTRDIELTADYRGLTLRSVFQPIASAAHGTVVGYEALLRATSRGGRPIDPPVVFEEASDVGELELVNRLVCPLHFSSFQSQDPGDCLLFANISTGVLRQLVEPDENLHRLAASCGLSPDRIVIEIPEDQPCDDEGFSESLDQLKRDGFRVAIGDFGTGLSNVDRVFKCSPAIVKMDVGLIARARSDRRLRKVFCHLTEMLHDIDAAVLAEGIESVDDALLMTDAGVDFLQGFWLSRPAPDLDAMRFDDQFGELRQARATLPPRQ